MGHYIYWHFPYKQFLPGLTGTSPDSIRRGRNGTYNPMMPLITRSLLSGKELAEEKSGFDERVAKWNNEKASVDKFAFL